MLNWLNFVYVIRKCVENGFARVLKCERKLFGLVWITLQMEIGDDADSNKSLCV